MNNLLKKNITMIINKKYKSKEEKKLKKELSLLYFFLINYSYFI